ncbi:MAG TPA: MSMEG_0570 family nitrogen starvation response protein [Chthoniobacterales bacterium]
MPEVHFTIELPDGVEKYCYSPSTIIRSHFSAGEKMPASEFLRRSRAALTEASDRVRAKYGFACTSAAAQIADFEHTFRAYPADGIVRILTI